MRYISCPYCKQSNAKDDVVKSFEVSHRSYNGDECVVIESRTCNVCYKVFRVEMHYKFSYEKEKLDN